MYAAKFSIPKQEAGRELNIEQTTEALQQWLDDLPITDIEKSTVLLLQLLIPANRCDLEINFRINLMHKLTDTADHLVNALRTKYSITGSPYASTKSAKRVEATKVLLREMGYGFKIIITKLYGMDDSTVQQSLSHALFQTIRLNGRRLVESYSLYEPVASDIWGELSLAYRFSVKRGIHKKIFTFNSVQSSIENIYMQLLLLEAVNPYRLMSGEAEKVYYLMGLWADDSKLEPLPDPWDSQRSELVVNLNSGEPPYTVFAGSEPKQNSDLRVVNVSQVKKALDQHIKELHSGNKRHAAIELSIRLQQDMMQRLIGRWSSDVDRENERLPHEEMMELILGIKNCHTLFFVDESDIDSMSLDDFGLVPITHHWGSAPKKTSNPAKESVFKIDDPHHDIWAEKNTKVGAEDIIEKQNEEQEEQEEQEEPLSLASYSAKQVDVSSNGFGLEFKLASNLPVKVGDLVCLRIAGGNSWRLSDVRWQRVISKELGLVGLRLISDQPIALTCKALDGVGAGGTDNVCMLIHGNDLNDPAVELLAPAAIYEEGTLLVVTIDKYGWEVILTKKLEATPSFSRFKFKLLE